LQLLSKSLTDVHDLDKGCQKQIRIVRDYSGFNTLFTSEQNFKVNIINTLSRTIVLLNTYKKPFKTKKNENI
jgi:hypothetical protein